LARAEAARGASSAPAITTTAAQSGPAQGEAFLVIENLCQGGPRRPFLCIGRTARKLLDFRNHSRVRLGAGAGSPRPEFRVGLESRRPIFDP
jgi:hypothetical protein